MTTTHRARRPLVPRTLSGCCRARVVAQHCSECGKPAPWRTRLTDEEAERLAAREKAAAVVVAPLTTAQAHTAMYGED